MEDGQQRVFDEVSHVIAGVFAIEKFFRGSMQDGQLGCCRAGKIGAMDANAHGGDVIGDRLNSVVLTVDALVFDVAGDAVFDQHGLENVGNLVGHTAVGGQFSVEEGKALMELVEQFFVGEPDEVGKAGRDKLVG